MNDMAEPRAPRSHHLSKNHPSPRRSGPLATLRRHLGEGVAVRILRCLLLASVLTGSVAATVALADELSSPASVPANAAFTPSPVPTGIPEFRFNLRGPNRYADEESGLIYNGARSVVPGLNRFLQPDPSGLDGGWNRYANVLNDALGLYDPDGYAPTKPGARPPEPPITVPITAGAVGRMLLPGGAPRLAAPIPACPPLASRGTPDFVISRDGAVLHSSPDKLRMSLESAGMRGKQVSNASGTESGTIHNIPDMKMDVRTMDGGPNHPPRVVTSREGTTQPVNPADGSNFGNVPKLEQRSRSHIVFP